MLSRITGGYIGKVGSAQRYNTLRDVPASQGSQSRRERTPSHVRILSHVVHVVNGGVVMACPNRTQVAFSS